MAINKYKSPANFAYAVGDSWLIFMLHFILKKSDWNLSLRNAN
ncbi:MAG: hypothetical protein ACI9RM_002903 [Ulvibacter sp.]